MADDKKLKLELQATGGTAAAKEVGKVETSVEELAKQASETRVLVNHLAEALDRAAAESTPAAKELKEVAAQLDNVEEKAIAATAAQRQLAQGTGPVAKGGSNAAFAFLEFSRAIEDAQYGVRGVINNIPTLVSYMGAGAGVAGVASLAAVALAQLLPLLMDTGEAAKAQAEKLATSQETAQEAVESLTKQIEAQRQARTALEAGNVLDLGKAAAQRWQDEELALRGVITQYKAYMAVKLEEISAAAAIETARINAAESSGAMSTIEAVQARAAVADQAEAEALKERQSAAEMEIAVAQQRVKNAEAQVKDLQRSEANATKQAAASEAAAQQEEELVAAFEDRRKALETAQAAYSKAVAAASSGSFGTPEQEAAAMAALASADTNLQGAGAAFAASQAAVDRGAVAGMRADAGNQAKIADDARKMREEAEATARALATQAIELEKITRFEQQRDAIRVSANAAVRGIQTGSTVATEQARANEAAAAEAANANAMQVAETIRAQVAGANAGADTSGLIPVLLDIANTLGNGTNAAESAQVMAQLATAIQSLKAEQTASRALLNQVMDQLRNNPAR